MISIIYYVHICITYYYGLMMNVSVDYFIKKIYVIIYETYIFFKLSLILYLIVPNMANGNIK